MSYQATHLYFWINRIVYVSLLNIEHEIHIQHGTTMTLLPVPKDNDSTTVGTIIYTCHIWDTLVVEFGWLGEMIVAHPYWFGLSES